MSEKFNEQVAQPLQFRPATSSVSNSAENTSGRKENTIVPESIAKKFNWGAFLLNWIWGLGNKSYITLIIFAVSFVTIIPFVGLFALIGCQVWFGIKGNEWAWRNKKWIDEEHFHKVQRKWATAGVILSILSTIIMAVSYTLIFASLMMGAPGMGTY